MLVSGRQVQFVLLFEMPIGAVEGAFLQEIERGVSLSASLIRQARGAIVNVVPDQPGGPKLES